ncbi:MULTISPECIES: hypothetical protein [unclassified Butyrivibrio]|uniref:hypothetical protein n=1 Tax=unclassified Butyrivibrio TaxID=2639466 RepID=UPI0003B57CF4|nr:MULTISPECIES: hypothetical protein [unclassified Butyrivibrio]
MKIGISACSNGHLPEWQDQITELEQVLDNMNIETALSPHIIITCEKTPSDEVGCGMNRTDV